MSYFTRRLLRSVCGLEDQDEDQDDKTKIKTAMNTKIKAKTQHTHLVTITEATLVILDLHLRRALFLFEDTGAIAAEELTIASSVDRVEGKVGANGGGRRFFWCVALFFLVSPLKDDPEKYRFYYSYFRGTRSYLGR